MLAGKLRLAAAWLLLPLLLGNDSAEDFGGCELGDCDLSCCCSGVLAG